ncbi:hypothetical protein J7T55_011752 [Diaporthe amygdali]|uniref:uncharacterized protein n=1 Tax=Phomopsis amygdali TaxID=1214568 RepID=UPI0022FE4A1C|nr:uncharacterized protein J7T55_011752 [Diaporthe amygdali]KAJ0123287.1 hypothetical protein J7T55_011752 [Diaporthe amygdali]
MFVKLVLGSALAYVFWSLWCMEVNARKARALKVPFVRLPVDVTNVFWLVLQRHVWAVVDRLPFQWSAYPDFVRFSRRDWQFREKSDPAVRLGPVWALVTPVTIYLRFTDPEAIKEIFARPSEFIRPVKEYTPFNESIMKSVWGESLHQTKSMVLYWTGKSAGIPSVQKDMRTLTLNVLAATTFNQPYEFHGSAEAQDEVGTYRDTLQAIMTGAILMMLIPYRFLQAPLPESFVRIGNAARSFRRHMLEMLDSEIKALQENRPGSGGMMTAFVRALDVHDKEADNAPDVKVVRGGQRKKGLSVDEILGNLFIINFAGYDTSASTLVFTLHLLAVHPEVQVWLAEEIAALAASAGKSIEEWDYRLHFPQLKRCRAVLLETLRLYPSIVGLPKWTGTKPQTLDIGHRTLAIPSGAYAFPHIIAIHTHPQYWDEPHSWRPSRWICSSPHVATGKSDSPFSGGKSAGREELWEPAPNTYFPWSDGPQSCPGKKFVQVEVVAILACLFKSHRLSVKKNPGESEEAARARVISCVNEVNMEVILRMKDADRVKLLCTEA